MLGKDVARLRRHQVPYLRRQMGIIFQDFRLIPTMTVYENIAFAMHVTNVKSKEIRDRVEYMLELVHLEDKAKAYPDTLSGGEQQRVAVARALAHGPKLVIADEPTGNIDPELSLEMMELLERVSEMGITVVVVTHEHELVRQFHQRVGYGKRIPPSAAFRQGVLFQGRTVYLIYKNPCSIIKPYFKQRYPVIF